LGCREAEGPELLDDALAGVIAGSVMEEGQPDQEPVALDMKLSRHLAPSRTVPPEYLGVALLEAGTSLD